MPRLASQFVFHPRLQHRYFFFTSKLPMATIFARSAQQPKLSSEKVKVDYMSSNYTMKGKTEWQDITLSCYAFEGITIRQIYDYFNNHHMDVAEATEKSADNYKHKIQLFLVNPLQAPTGVWALEGAYMTDVSWGNMDWGSDDVMECEVTISYDWAELL